MSLTDFATGMQHGLRQLMADGLQQQELARKAQMEAELMDIRRQRLKQQGEYQNAQFESLREQRDALADQRRQNAAHTLAGDLSIGDALDPQQISTLRGGNLGSLIEHQGATLPSTQHTGFLLSAPKPRQPIGGGFLRTVSREGHPEQDVFRGTPGQRKTVQQQQALRSLIDSLPGDSRERMALQYQLTTGENPPAALMPREVTTRYSAHTLFDDEGQPTGIGAFNTASGEIRPVAGGSLRGRGSRQPLERRVENWILGLRRKHPRYEDALTELTSVLANAPDEQFSQIEAAKALRQLYAQPIGSDLFSSVGIDVGSILGEAGRGGVGSSDLRGVARQQLQAARRQAGDMRPVSDDDVDTLLSRPGNAETLRRMVAGR